MSNRTMCAAVLAAPGKIELHEVAIPEPAPHQVRVKLAGCGVCGSNLALWEGRPWFQYPREAGAPGHEGWGVIEDVGREVPSSWIGQHVAMLSYHAFAQYDLADVKQVVPLPAALADQPFPGEAIGCAINIFRRCGVRAGQHVAIVGAGFLGILLVQLSVQAGARTIAISRRQFALDLALKAGACAAIPMLDHRAILEQVMKTTAGRGCEVVIEAVGEQWPLDLAGELTAERGRLVVAGYHQDPRSVNMQMWNWRGLDVINAHERAPEAYLRGMRDAVSAVLSRVIDPAPLYTHSFPLAQLGEALTGLRERPNGMLKSWVTM